MLRHLLKPIWKRKSRNLMLSLEILLAFLVVFAVTAIGVRYYQLYHLPTGFAYRSVWSVQMQQPDEGGFATDPVLYDKLARSLRELPEVERIAFAAYSPYEGTTWQTDSSRPDSSRAVVHNVMQVSDDFFATLDMPLREGRWFSAADEGAAVQPIIVNRRFADEMFPGEPALGKVIVAHSVANESLRVTGVIDDFRNRGEFMAPVNFVLTRFSPQSSPRGVNTVLLKVRPGTDRAFETRLSERLKLVRGDWSYRITPLADTRDSQLRETLTPLVVLAVVGGFLLLMVAFGLFGVLWQSTTQRIPEIGLRRAIGATAGSIYRQIVVEQLLLTSLALAVGLVLLVQLPITGVFGENLGWPLFGVAALLSMAVMSLVSVLCAVYPAWRASRLSPTQALHHE